MPGLKALLDIHDYYGGPCRLPLLDLDEKDSNTLKQMSEQITQQSSSTAMESNNEFRHFLINNK